MCLNQKQNTKNNNCMGQFQFIIIRSFKKDQKYHYQGLFYQREKLQSIKNHTISGGFFLTKWLNKLKKCNGHPPVLKLPSQPYQTRINYKKLHDGSRNKSKNSSMSQDYIEQKQLLESPLQIELDDIIQRKINECAYKRDKELNIKLQKTMLAKVEKQRFYRQWQMMYKEYEGARSLNLRLKNELSKKKLEIDQLVKK